MATFATGCHETDTPASAVVIATGFAGGLDESWSIVREDPTGWELANGTLRIRSDPGGLAIDNANVNMPLHRAPDEPFAVEVTVRFVPTSLYEQAGLVLYADDANYAKLQYEMLEEGRALTFTRERNGDFAEIASLPTEAPTVRLRLVYADGTIRAMARQPADSAWTDIGALDLVLAPLSVGLATGGGSAADRRWVGYSDWVLFAEPAPSR